MWDRIWINGNLATLTGGADDGYGVLRDGALAVEGDKITWVGARKDLPDAPDALAHEVIDLDGAWITPGLIDCHTHLVYGGNRADEFEKRLNGVSYEEIAKAGGGIRSSVNATRAASEETLLAAAQKRLNALLREGVTTVEIKSGYGLRTGDEAKMLRVARRLGVENAVDVVTTFLGAHALPPEFQGDADGYIDLVCDEMLPAIAREKLADAVDAFCENIAFDTTQTRKVFEAAKKTWPAGETACRTAQRPKGRGAGRRLQCAVGRSSGISRRRWREGNGGIGHGGGFAARGILLPSRNKAAAA
jgi:imidazolonepropionase